MVDVKMMCPEPNNLAAWFDGQRLPADAKAAVETHVRDCPACAATVAGWRAVGDRIRAAPLPVAPAGTHGRWAAALRVARDRQVRRFAAYMTAAASVVLAVTLPMATNTPAAARPVLADWEAVAVAGGDESTSTQQAQARLMAVDLALPTNAPAAGGGR